MEGEGEGEGEVEREVEGLSSKPRNKGLGDSQYADMLRRGEIGWVGKLYSTADSILSSSS